MSRSKLLQCIIMIHRGPEYIEIWPKTWSIEKITGRSNETNEHVYFKRSYTWLKTGIDVGNIGYILNFL